MDKWELRQISTSNSYIKAKELKRRPTSGDLRNSNGANEEKRAEKLLLCRKVTFFLFHPAAD